MTTLLPPNVKVHLALGFIDMRKGIDGLAMLVHGVLHHDPFTGHLFVFRGRTRANLIKIIYWDGTGFCLFTKRLEHGQHLADVGFDVGLIGFEPAEVDIIFEGHWDESEQPENLMPEETSGASVSRLGDVWPLEKHILVCGDSTNVETYL